MKTFKVLVEKQYLIGHYVEVPAESDGETPEQGRERVQKALASEEEGGSHELYERIEASFEDMDDQIDELFEGEGFILNAPGRGCMSDLLHDADNAAGISLPEVGSSGLTSEAGNGVWGRPLVLEVQAEQTAAIG